MSMNHQELTAGMDRRMSTVVVVMSYTHSEGWCKFLCPSPVHLLRARVLINFRLI